MENPNLIVIAGPNGSGKSTISAELLKPFGIDAFDFDKEFHKVWNKFDFDPTVEEGVRQSTINKFSDYISQGIELKEDISFETNYHTDMVLNIVSRAKECGFNTHLRFICLESEQMAIERVAHRVKAGGHYVDPQTIRIRYLKGLKLLDNTFRKYDSGVIYESMENYELKKCILIEGNRIKQNSSLSVLGDLPYIKSALSILG